MAIADPEATIKVPRVHLVPIEDQPTIKHRAPVWKEIEQLAKRAQLAPKQKNHIEIYTLSDGDITSRIQYALALYQSDWQILPHTVYYDSRQIMKLNYDFWLDCLNRGCQLKAIELPEETVVVWGCPYA